MNTSMSGYQGMRGATGGLAGSGSRIPKGYSQGTLQQFTPEQMQLFQSLFSQVSPQSYTGRLAGGDQSLFGEIEAPALRQFNELQGNIASRFSGMGSGARRSSGFQNASSAAASNFAQDLQSRRQMLQQQAIQDLMGMSSSLLQQRPQQNFLVRNAPKRSFLKSLFGGGLPLAGAAAGGFFGGPFGAALGSQLGGSAGAGFMGQPQGPIDYSGLSGLPRTWG